MAARTSSQPASASEAKAAPDWPVAIITKESLVEVSPSTVMQLKDASAASLTNLSSRDWAMPASVATKPSMVAMFGLIMPAPLEMPETVIVLPPTVMRREAALATVSVVMMACAAACQLSAFRSALAAGRPAFRRSTGSGSRMTPVEKGRTWSAAMPSNAATASQEACAVWRPGSPVPALAMPVLMTKARISLPVARWLRQS